MGYWTQSVFPDMAQKPAYLVTECFASIIKTGLVWFLDGYCIYKLVNSSNDLKFRRQSEIENCQLALLFWPTQTLNLSLRIENSNLNTKCNNSVAQKM